jgi:pimeloyl-ACP methyl ester carboxylesterase
MDAAEAGGAAERILVGAGGAAREIALRRRPGATPGIVWLGGFMSDMAGRKAEAIDAFAAAHGRAFLRFDYSGHGISGGAFAEGTISRWLEEAAAVLALADGPQVLVGSSMGGWLALLLAEVERRAGSGRIAGLVLIAPAVDMTETLIWARLPGPLRDEMRRNGSIRVPSGYDDGSPYLITRGLIEDGARHLFGGRLIETGCPVAIVQGLRDDEVPWRHTTALLERLASDDVVLTLIKDGDHRLSRPEDLERIVAALEGILAEAAA